MRDKNITINVRGRGKMFIHKARYLGTSRFCYSVWITKKDCSSLLDINGSTITCEDWTNNQWCYALRTRNLPKSISAMPYGNERIIAVREWHRHLDEKCYKIIVKHFPEAGRGIFDMGDISCTENSQ